MDVFDLAKKVETEEAALEFAYGLGLVRRTAPECPSCGQTMKWERGIKRRGIDGIWRCRNRTHARTALSLFDGSILHLFRIPVSLFLKLVYCIAQRMSVKDAAVNARMSPKTVVKIHKILRTMMSQFNAQNNKRIGRWVSPNTNTDVLG